MKLAEDDGRNYLQNFIADYFNLSDIGLKKVFNIEKSSETKERIKTFDINVYHKSEKNRSQVVIIKTLEDCNKIQYISKKENIIFILKIDFLYFRTVEMIWFKKLFSSQSSQETKVVYQKTEDEKSDQTDDKQEGEDEKITESEF